MYKHQAMNTLHVWKEFMKVFYDLQRKSTFKNENLRTLFSSSEIYAFI
jgi:hypothetical protein